MVAKQCCYITLLCHSRTASFKGFFSIDGLPRSGVTKATILDFVPICFVHSKR